MPIKKLDYDFVKNTIEKEGYQLLSTEYKNAKSKIKVECDKGHVYNVSYDGFKHGRRCPLCSRKQSISKRRLSYNFVKSEIEKIDGYKLLSKTYSNNLTKLKIQCSKGHLCQISFAKFKNGQRCSICTKIEKPCHNKLSIEDVKEVINMEKCKLLSKEYINVKNKLNIKCSCGNDFSTSFQNFRRGVRCGDCRKKKFLEKRGLSYNFVKSEIEKVNGYKLLSTEYINSRVKLKVKCDNGHEYQVSYGNFQQGYRCPKCFEDKRGVDCRLDYSFIKSKIEEDGYKLLSDDYVNANAKIKVQCNNDHIYNVTYSSFQQGGRCLKCYNDRRGEKLILDYDLVKGRIECDGYKLLSEKYENSTAKLKIQCDKNHIYEAAYSSFRQGQRCPRCSKAGTSKMEKSLQNWLSQYIDIDCNKRFYYDKHKFYEADIYIASKNIAIEFNGLYYHSELYGKDKNYHLDKTKFFEDKGIQLIHVFENEWILKQDIVKSIILSKIGCLDNKVYARKCHIKNVSYKEIKDFLNDNHLQGYVSSKVNLGLFNKDDESLVAVMTFSKPRFNKGYDYEMIRFCNKLNTSVSGGFSKLLKHFVKTHNNASIISYSDRRYSNGVAYLSNGFALHHISKPNYFYFSCGSYQLESRNKYQKHKLCDKLEKFDKNLTEWQNMQDNGFNRIYDCGNLVFILEK